MRTPKEDREITAGGYTYQENGTRAERMTIYTSDYSYMAKLDKYVEKTRKNGMSRRFTQTAKTSPAKYTPARRRVCHSA